MIDLRGPNPLRAMVPCDIKKKKVRLSSHVEQASEQHCSTLSASIPIPGSCSEFLLSLSFMMDYEV